MRTLTLAQATPVTVGGTPCLMLTYDHDTGERTAHIIPTGTITYWAGQYDTTDANVLVDLLLYEPHMPGPDLAAGLDDRLAQLADAQASVTITVPDPTLLDPLRNELANATTPQQEEAA